jgi:hypothetical protein
MTAKVRPIYEIAAEIRKLWRKKDGTPNVWFGAVPYLEAMECLDKVTDMFYDDTAKSVVIYFLSNASTWCGDDARRIRAELRSMFGLKQ